MKTKTLIRFFTIVEHEKEEAFLRQMHKDGWALVSTTPPCIYRFAECTPEDVVYRLDYNQDGLAHKEEYVQMFRDCGWEYILDCMGFAYFRKPVAAPGSEDIFCDDESRLGMIQRIFFGRIVPLFVIMTALLVPQFINSLDYHADGFDLAVTIVLGLMIGIYLVVFAAFGWKYVRYMNGRKK